MSGRVLVNMLRAQKGQSWYLLCAYAKRVFIFEKGEGVENKYMYDGFLIRKLPYVVLRVSL